MTEQESASLLRPQSFSVVAPAGHGKTEMITELVSHSCGRTLLLTHTNAGVDALEKRLRKRSVPSSLYRIATIASFCGSWCKAYYRNANLDKSPSLYLSDNAEKDYERSYVGAKEIFSHAWAGVILRASYSSVIVDEYQDCTKSQHEMFLAISKFLPVKIFGDPMQGIFSFGGNLVDWNSIEFENVPVKTSPWRWHETNPLLGEYLGVLREQLSPCLYGHPCDIHIEPCNGSIEILPPDVDYYKLSNYLSGRYEKIVYLTRWPRQQLAFCQKMRGRFQYDEKQDCDELFEYSRHFDEKIGAKLFLSVIEFAGKCATQVRVELSSYIHRLEKGNLDFHRISKHPELGKLLTECEKLDPNDSVGVLLEWFRSNDLFKKYRSELLSEMIRSVRYARSQGITLNEASHCIRATPGLQRRYNQFQFLASRTLLSKGLEFDCVIIDMSSEKQQNRLSAKEFYVAMTRAMKRIFIIAPSSDLHLL